MSVQMNTYCIVGALLPYKPFRDDKWHDKLEPYMDSAFEGIKHHDGLCVLFDGMNGDYVAIGHVIAKTEDSQGFDKPIEVPSGNPLTEMPELEKKIRALVPNGVEVRIGCYVISHYR